MNFCCAVFDALGLGFHNNFGSGDLGASLGYELGHLFMMLVLRFQVTCFQGFYNAFPLCVVSVGL